VWIESHQFFEHGETLTLRQLPICENGIYLYLNTKRYCHRSNSGWVEGLNNKIEALKRRCYGIANPISLFRRIWLDLGGYKAFAIDGTRYWGHPRQFPRN